MSFMLCVLFADIPDRLTQIQALNLLVLQLPLAERATLKVIVDNQINDGHYSWCFVGRGVETSRQTA